MSSAGPHTKISELSTVDPLAPPFIMGSDSGAESTIKFDFSKIGCAAFGLELDKAEAAGEEELASVDDLLKQWTNLEVL
jgi:hypothetical protein